MKCCKITAYLILFLLVGCGSTKKSSDTGGLGEPCHPDGTCEEPYICEQDLCRSPDNGNNNLNNNNENNNVNNNNNHNNNNNNNGLVEPTITVTTSMTAEEAYTAIESAEEGDVVFIEPGIYQFRVYLANSGTPENPILIRGSDPENPPIFDYEGRDCDQWPGSDSGRLHYWAWQIQGSYITIENLVIRHARMDSDMNRSSAGIFIGPETIYAEPTPDDTIPRSITLRNIEIYGCDDGLQGTAEGTLVETCVLHSNGTQFSSRPRHNVYLQGGSATFRFCHVFDPTSGANLTLRTRDFRMEYSKLGEFVSSHSIQVLTNKAQQTNGESYQQTITLIGNEFDGHRNHENGMSKFIILLNSNSYVGNRMHANLFYNTFNGASGNMGSFVQLAVQNGTEALGAYVYNNIAINNQRPIRIESGHSYTDPLYDIDVRNNWWPAGNYDAWSEVMSDNIFGGDPFTESAGKANTDLGEIPSHEPLGPVRSSVVDPGAYSLE